MAQQDDKHSDQSMEEILQSIKRIIADESDEDEVAATSDDDVLDLTEFAMADADEAPAEEKVAAPAFVDDFDSFNPPELPKAPDVPDTTIFAEEAASPPVDDFADSLISASVAKASSDALQSLLSAAPANHALPETAPSMPFRSGNTVEDLVREALRPMLQDWLEANLTAIVERVVEREARRLSGR